MGAAMYPVFKEPIEPGNPMVDGKCLAHNDRRLDRAAKAAGVEPLGAFFGMGADAMADLLGLEADELDLPDEADAEEKWFSAAEGLRTVRALLTWIRASPGSLKDEAGVIDELVECERQLAIAEARGIPFHLANDL